MVKGKQWCSSQVRTPTLSKMTAYQSWTTDQLELAAIFKREEVAFAASENFTVFPKIGVRGLLKVLSTNHYQVVFRFQGTILIKVNLI